MNIKTIIDFAINRHSSTKAPGSGAEFSEKAAVPRFDFAAPRRYFKEVGG
jgi:hypothetical protein